MIELKEGLVLYHGSYCVVENPDLQKCAVYKDFGQGFYLTTSKEQAKSFARLSAAKKRQQGERTEEFAYVSFFKLSDTDGLKTFVYETADAAWLHCIVAHRRKDAFVKVRNQMKPYDVISGKIANDDTNTTIMAYMGNVFGKMGSESADKVCIGLLIPERLKDQFCFRSVKALSKLKYLKSEKVSLE